MKKLCLLVIYILLGRVASAQTDSLFYGVESYIECMRSSTSIYKFNNAFNRAEGIPFSYPLNTNHVDANYISFDRKNHLSYVMINSKLNLYDIINHKSSGFSTNKISYYSYSCKDTTMFCVKQKDTLSTTLSYLYKIYPKNNLTIPVSLTPFYTGAITPQVTIDEKNKTYCFFNSLYQIVSVSLNTGNVVSVTNTNLGTNQTNFGLNYNTNDSLLYTVLVDNNTHQAFLRKVNVNTLSIFTFSSNIAQATSSSLFFPSKNTIIDFRHNVFCFTQKNYSIPYPAKNIVMNEIDIVSGTILSIKPMINDDDDFYIGFIYAEPCPCNLIDNCPSDDESTIIIPNVFTPNNDDVNDYFSVKTHNINNFNCQIYNRWGQLMFEFNDTNSNWNGNTKNQSPCSNGVYFYQITYTDGGNKTISKTGHIQLLR